MRSYINIIERLNEGFGTKFKHGVEARPDARDSDYDQPYIAAGRKYGSGPMVEIYMFYVPKELRGTGAGRKFYEEWEAALPADIERVELDAANYGDGSGHAGGFWEAMGYDFKWDGRITQHDANRMQKGVNGHPTPDTIEVYDDDEDED